MELAKIVRYINKHRVLLRRIYKYAVLPLGLGFALYALIFYATVNTFSARVKTINIERQDTGSLILWKLQSKGIVYPRHNYKLAVRLTGLDRSFHAGRYKVSPSYP